MKTIAVVGLGYVGLDLAVELGQSFSVIGYDISTSRISELQNHHDRNLLVDSSRLANSEICFVHKVEQIRAANFFIVAVSTPAFYYEMPNLDSLMNATKDIASQLKVGDVVVFESTVYPGTTEEVCLPLLEQLSHLKCGVDFKLGYSVNCN